MMNQFLRAAPGDSRRTDFLWRAGLLLAWLLVTEATAAPGTGSDRIVPGTVPHVPALLSAQFFQREDVPLIDVTVNAADLAALDKSPRDYVKATVREGGRTFREVGLHLKGGISSFEPIGSKPALTLNFDKFLKGQSFHGLDKVHLNNCFEDSTFMREILATAAFRAAGVPTPRAINARVKLNGRDLGVYVLKEGFDRAFLKQHFANPDGAVYDSGTVRDLDELVPSPSGGRPTVAGNLRAVWDAAHEADPVKRWQELEPVLDMDRFITFIAVEALAGHCDGYAMTGNNYRVYHDPTTRRFVFMPTGMDQAFNANCDFYPEDGGFVAEAVVKTPEGRRRYDERLEQLIRTQWDGPGLLRNARKLQQKLRPLVDQEFVESFDDDVADLIEEIEELSRMLAEHAAQLRSLVRFSSNKEAPLLHWTVRRGKDNARLESVNEAGRRQLSIASGPEADAGAWTSKVSLSTGRYRFEGIARVADVVTTRARRAGACLRVSGDGESARLTGNQPWTSLAVEFQVDDWLQEFDLRCELSGAKGQCWFDLQSLRLVRLPN
jgi:spore coat protein CotH